MPRRWIAGVLALLTLAVYLPVQNHEFIEYDDNVYVSKNELIQQGFTLAGIKFAFGKLSGTHTYWHPVTWLSHMLDCELFGTEPGPHHLVNVGFHALNVVLLFLWLQALTGRRWPSAVVAMLFAWHPLQVDTVAWVAERKNLLSACFWILASWAYTTYAQGGRRAAYLGAFGLFAVGLMCKPAIVTLPCVWLLLDIWPLQRITFPSVKLAAQARRLLWEKVPFLGLTVVSSVITLQAHAGMGILASVEHTPLAARIANSFASYALYLRNVVWPRQLAVVYPQDLNLPWGIVAAGVVLVVTLVITGVALVRTRPYWLVGCGWFLGALVPTIGIVQAGHQAMADRFVYVPLIGLFIALVWAAADLLARWPVGGRAATIAAVVVGTAGLALTSRQVGYWKDTRSVFEHAAAVTKDNYIAQRSLGYEAVQRGEFAAGLAYFLTAERIAPGDVVSSYGIALACMNMNRLEEAEARLSAILKQKPTHAYSHHGLGYLRMQQGRFDEARDYFLRALALDPEIAEARTNLELIQTGAARAFPELLAVKARLESEPANVELRLRVAGLLTTVLRPNEAATQYQKVLEQQPGEPRALTGLGTLAAREGKTDEAITLLERALAADGKHGEARVQLGAVLELLGRAAEARQQYETAVQTRPELAEAWASLGLLEAKTGRMGAAAAALERAASLRPDHAEFQMRAGLAAATWQRAEPAARHLRAALRLRPDWHPPMTALAWLLATHPDAAARDGAEAVKLARRACELTKFENPGCLDALGAALAETGDFAGALATMRQALELARSQNLPSAVGEFAARLELYRQGQRYQQPRVPPSSP